MRSLTGKLVAGNLTTYNTYSHSYLLLLTAIPLVLAAKSSPLTGHQTSPCGLVITPLHSKLVGLHLCQEIFSQQSGQQMLLNSIPIRARGKDCCLALVP